MADVGILALRPTHAEPEPSLTPDPLRARTTISEALEAYLIKVKSRDIKGSTLCKYKTLTNQLRAYCTDKGYIYIDQPGVIDIRQPFRSAPR